MTTTAKSMKKMEENNTVHDTDHDVIISTEKHTSMNGT
jgi:hypothetical protein